MLVLRHFGPMALLAKRSNRLRSIVCYLVGDCFASLARNKALPLPQGEGECLTSLSTQLFHPGRSAARPVVNSQ